MLRLISPPTSLVAQRGGSLPPAAVAAVCLATLAGCREAGQYQPPPPPPVTVSRPLQQSVTNYLEETGTTEAVERVEIRARVTGFLEEVRFEPGEGVEEDEVLYLIEQRPFQAAVDAANAQLAAADVELNRAEIDYKREQELMARDATSEQSLLVAKTERDSAEAAVQVAKAALDRAQLDLDYTEVKTPISGRVGKTLVKSGNLVDGNSATELTTVIKYDPIWANFNISERALLDLSKSRDEEGKRDLKEIQAFLKRAGDRGYPYEGRLDYADLAVDQSTGTFMIRAAFANPDLEIVPGLFVQVRVPIGIEENALLVPERAIGSDQAGKYVLVVNSENKVERRDVLVASKHENLVVVAEGLLPDEWVIVEGLQRSRPGAEVNPTQTELPPLASDAALAEEPPPDAGGAATPPDAAGGDLNPPSQP